jgi:hypothetical protein
MSSLANNLDTQSDPMPPLADKVTAVAVPNGESNLLSEGTICNGVASLQTDSNEIASLRDDLTQMALVSKDFLSKVDGFYGWDENSLDFTGELPRQLRVDIPECCQPSNSLAPTRAAELLYVHGMRVNAEDLDLHLSYLALCFGKPITVVVNAQEQPLFKGDSRGGIRSVAKSAAALLSSRWGSQLEIGPVLTAARHIEKQVLDNNQALQIVAHSQGGIILANALDHLLGPQSRLSDYSKQLIRDRIEIFTFGSGEHFFPVGVNVIECAHGSDPVTRITTPTTVARNYIVEQATWLNEKLSSFANKGARIEAWLESLPVVIKKERAPMVQLRGGHSLQGYLENLPEFFIERFREEGGDINSEKLALALVESITKGEFSDLIHARIIQERLKECDALFGERLKSLCTTEGLIGDFQVPFFSQLGVRYGDVLPFRSFIKKDA